MLLNSVDLYECVYIYLYVCAELSIHECFYVYPLTCICVSRSGVMVPIVS